MSIPIFRRSVRALPQTIRELAEAEPDPAPADATAEQARQDIAACDAKLRQHRAALEAGADPAVVTGWIAAVQAQRTAAEARLHQQQPSQRPGQRAGRDLIELAITSLGNVADVLASADHARKAETYASLGLTVTYRPAENTATVKVRPIPNPDIYVRKCPRGYGTYVHARHRR